MIERDDYVSSWGSWVSQVTGHDETERGTQSEAPAQVTALQSGITYYHQGWGGGQPLQFKKALHVGSLCSQIFSFLLREDAGGTKSFWT